MESLEEIARRISEGNKSSRERFSSLAVRTARAIYQGDQDELNRITNDATEMDGDTSGHREETGQAGTVDGSDGEPGATTPQQ